VLQVFKGLKLQDLRPRSGKSERGLHIEKRKNKIALNEDHGIESQVKTCTLRCYRGFAVMFYLCIVLLFYR
jgi:hypothetical protein